MVVLNPPSYFGAQVGILTHKHGHGGGRGHHHHGDDHAHGAHDEATPGGVGSGAGRRRVQAEREKDGRRLAMALTVTGVIAVTEVVGGYLSNSLALMSDAGHMLTDLSALGLSLLALWFGGKPADIKKTYGYYRLEILSALLNGVLLLGITGFIVFEAIERLRHPSPVQLGTMAMIAAIGLVANLISLQFLNHSHSLNVRGAFLHVLGDTLSSVGVLVGAGIIALTGWYVVDAIVSLLIAVVIVLGAVRLVRDAVDVLLEAVPSHVDLDAVRTLMSKVNGVTSVHDLHVWTITSGIYALSVHLVVANAMACNNDEILSAVKHDLFERFGIDHTTIQIESETYAHVGEIH